MFNKSIKLTAGKQRGYILRHAHFNTARCWWAWPRSLCAVSDEDNVRSVGLVKVAIFRASNGTLNATLGEVEVHSKPPPVLSHC